MNAALPEVRIIRPSDEDEVMEMILGVHAETGMFALSDAKVRDCIKKCLTKQGMIIGVIGEPGHIQGSICLAISDNWYTDEWHLAEMWNYVLPDYRRSANGEALVEFGKACADKMQIPFFIGVITNRRMAGKVRMYRRLLGHPCGAFFVYNHPKWKAEPMMDHGGLKDRLRQLSKKCNEVKVGKTQVGSLLKREVGPILKEAADAIGHEDNLWDDASKKTNGATTAHIDGSD